MEKMRKRTSEKQVQTGLNRKKKDARKKTSTTRKRTAVAIICDGELVLRRMTLRNRLCGDVKNELLDALVIPEIRRL